VSVSRAVVAATTAWLVVVAVGSVLVWSVISRAGDVAPGSGTAVPAATPAPSSESAAPGAGTASPSSSTSPGGAQDGVERRTWQGAGGYVSVECRERVISLVAAQADAGFVVEVDERGPEEVKVAFEGQGEEGRASEVAAACRAGVPEFEVRTED
jgi:hypothetical protein